MIRFLQHDMIDKSSWDNCINHAVNGNLYAFSWYLDIVSPDWCALVENEYEKVFPLPVSSKAGFNYLMQPYFTQQLGLFYQSMLSEDKLTEFLNTIPSAFKYIDINLNTSNKLTAATNVTQMINLELDLISEYADIASRYQSNLKRNLIKATQNILTLSKHVRPEDIISLFRANKGQELIHLNDHQYTLIQHIAYESIHKGKGEIWGTYDEFNQLVAGVLWVFSHSKAIFLFSALSENGKKLNAMPFIIDQFIRQNSGKPLTLDFEGSNNEGLARFYSSFGAKKVIYQRYTRDTLSFPFRIALKIWRLSRTQSKKVFHFVRSIGQSA
jgi:hypothetical protein